MFDLDILKRFVTAQGLEQSFPRFIKVVPGRLNGLDPRYLIAE